MQAQTQMWVAAMLWMPGQITTLCTNSIISLLIWRPLLRSCPIKQGAQCSPAKKESRQ